MALTPESINSAEYAFFLEREKHKKVFMNCGVYFIYNDITGDCYIGSSRNVKNRFANHKSQLRLNKHKNKHLQNAWNLYGGENFTFQLNEANHNIDKILDREKKLISIFKPRYNIKQVEGNSFYHSEETKKKISIKSKAKFEKNPLLIEKIREVGKRAASFNTGRKHSEEVRKNMSIASKKRGCKWFFTKESREKAAQKRRKKIVAYKDGIEYKTFESMSEAAIFVGGNTGNLNTGIRYNKIRYGYYWKYKN